jgi:integrase
VLRFANLRLEEPAAPATVNRELAALRAAYRLGLESDVILSMPRIKLLPENNVRKGFADADRVERIYRRLQPDVADAVRFMFITGWRSRSEVLPLTWAQVDFAGGFVRLEPGTTKNSEGRSFPLIPELRAPPRAPAGPYPSLRAWPRPDHPAPAGLPPIRTTNQVDPPHLADRLREGRDPRASAA